MSAERPFVLHTRVVTGTGGGPEKTILNSPRFLATLGYDSLCAYMHPPSDPGFETLEKRAADAQTPLVGIEDRGPWDWRAPRRLLELCRRHRVDVWHGHDYKSNAIGLMVRRFWPMKLVATAHGWVKFTRKTPLYHAVDRFCLRRCDHVVCVSDDLLQTCIAKGVRSDRCCLIENAIDTEHWRRRMSPDEAKRQLGLTPGRLLVGAVGRLSDEKGFNGLIRAADRLLSEGLDFELAIAGEGDYGPALQRLIRERQREDRIRLLGFRADTLDLFQAMDVFVLSSLREGLPNVVLEAMATETPVVATRIAGVPRVIEPDRTGLLVEPQDEPALADALRQTLTDADLRTRLAQAARRRIEQDFSFARRMEKMAQVYDRVLGRSTRVSPLPLGEGPGVRARDATSKCVDKQERAIEQDDSETSKNQPDLEATHPHPAAAPPPSPKGRGEETSFEIVTHQRNDLPGVLPRLDAFVTAQGHMSPSRRPGWIEVLARGLDHVPYCFEAIRADRTVGLLPLVYVRSPLFGRFLVGLPYLNVGGVVAEEPAVAVALVDRAVELADRLDVRYLELRHEQAVDHPALGQTLTSKVHMRLPLPDEAETLWKAFDPKVRNQIRKGQKQGFEVFWGGPERLDDFYAVFSRNMRDLGTPVFSRRLFEGVLACLPDEAELCTLRLDGRAVAAALLVHGPGMTEVPSASSLRRFNPTNANMTMYWLLLQRAIERGQAKFDFGRSSPDSNTYRFKKQWGALPEPAVWQYYVRRGHVSDMRLESGRYDLATRLWSHLPVWLANRLGPWIIRGIP